MQSSISLIKGNFVELNESMEVNSILSSDHITANEIEELYCENSEERKLYSLSQTILKKAKLNAENIVNEAKNTAKDIYQKAHADGFKNGYEDGYKEAYNIGYEEGKIAIQKETKDLLQKAEYVLENAKKDYENYIKEKEKEIINLVSIIAKTLAKKEFEKETSIIPLIKPILEKMKNENNLIIKCNGSYVEYLKTRLENIKHDSMIAGEVFILEDPYMANGSVIIQGEHGKTIVDITNTEECIDEILNRICQEEHEVEHKF